MATRSGGREMKAKTTDVAKTLCALTLCGFSLNLRYVTTCINIKSVTHATSVCKNKMKLRAGLSWANVNSSYFLANMRRHVPSSLQEQCAFEYD